MPENTSVDLPVRVPQWRLGGWLPWIIGATLGGFWWILIDLLRVDWEINPQYSYGWLVPVFSLYLFWKRWPARPQIDPNYRTACWLGVLIGLGAATLLPTHILAQSAPDWAVARWAMALQVIGLTLALLWAMGGHPTMLYFAWPVCFFLVSVAWPSGIEAALIQGLMHHVANFTAEVVGFAGYAAEPVGNLIRLEAGVVGVDEACSGVRSLQSMLMAALFLGELNRYRWSGRISLIVIGLVLALIFNVLRSLTLVTVAISQGLPALERWHDSAGLSILLLSFGALLFIVRFARFSTQPSELGAAASENTHKAGESGAFYFSPGLVFGLCAWLLFILAAPHWWYRKDSSALWDSRWSVEFPEQRAQFKNQPTTANVRKILGYSAGRQAAWVDGFGGRWTMFFFQWAPGRTSSGAARQHRPDVCLPASGRVLEEEAPGPVLEAGSEKLHFRRYLFRTRGEPLHVFFCLWEAGSQNGDGTAKGREWDWQSRLRQAWAHERNLGQQSLEVVVSGIESVPEAEAAFRAEMRGLLKKKLKAES